MNLLGNPKMAKFTVAIFVAGALNFFHAAVLDGRPPMPAVGVLTPGLTYEAAFDGLRDRLDKLGYRETREIRFIVEDGKGGLGRFSERAANLVAAKPAVLFTVATAPSVAAKQATPVIPIVFAVVAVQTGLVAGFGSSKNNVAKAMGVNIPRKVLIRADRLVE